MTDQKILLTGATGYIGGSILTTLLDSGITKSYSLSVLIRGQEKAQVFEKLKVTPIIFSGYEDLSSVQQAASQHDVIIGAHPGANTAAAKALILGLGERKKATGKDVHYIHTSGTSNLGDLHLTGTHLEHDEHSDKDNIYRYLKSRELVQHYPQRTTDITVVEAGLQEGVNTTIIMSPTIWGIGSGLFNKLSIQETILIRSALQTKQVEVIGEARRVLKGEEVPTGQKDILFSANGRFRWLELSQHIAIALVKLGKIETTEVRSISVKEAAQKYFGGNELSAEAGFASNSHTSSDIGRELGWRPVKTHQDFWDDIEVEIKAVLEKEGDNPVVTDWKH